MSESGHEASGSDASMVMEARVALTFFELTRTAVRGADVVDVLMLISERAVDLLPVDACGILVRDAGGALQTVGASSSSAELLELFQIQDAEGPCLDCLQTGAPVSTSPDDAAGRWPRFAALLADEGFTVVHASPMVARDHTVGALNVFGTVPLGPAERDIAQAFADLAALVLLQSDLVEDAVAVTRRLHLAVQARVTLGQAIGIVAERFSLDPDGAFRRLKLVAERNGASLAGLAASIVARDGSHPRELDLSAEDR